MPEIWVLGGVGGGGWGVGGRQGQLRHSHARPLGRQADGQGGADGQVGTPQTHMAHPHPPHATHPVPHTPSPVSVISPHTPVPPPLTCSHLAGCTAQSPPPWRSPGHQSPGQGREGSGGVQVAGSRFLG